MSHIDNKAQDSKPKSTCFLGCFRFSEKMSPGKVGSGSRKKTRMFFWSKFRMKKSGIRTVPVDATVSNKTNQNIKINQVSKPKSGKLTTRRKIPDTGHNPPGQIPAVVSDQSVIEKPQKTRYGPEQNTILENRKILDHFDSINDDTCQRRLSFSPKIESIRTSLSHPGSPETKPNSSSTTTVMPQLTSSSSRNREKGAANKSYIHHKDDINVGKFDPMVGMSIIMVTLIIMLFWGRLCAILCTSAWFYFIPRLGTSMESHNIIKNGPISVEADMNSGEYKKKVVLEGFLERNHRSPFRIL